MGQSRLNHVAFLNAHTNVLDELDMETMAEQFIIARNNRRTTFGHFTSSLQ